MPLPNKKRAARSAAQLPDVFHAFVKWLKQSSVTSNGAAGETHVTPEFVRMAPRGRMVVRIGIAELSSEAFIAIQRPDGSFDLKATPEYSTIASSSSSSSTDEEEEMPNEEGPPPSTDEVYDDQDYGDMRMQVDLALAKQSDHVEEERIKQRLSLDQFQDISRGDAEHWMRGQGFAEFQIQIAIALIFDKKSFATFAKELGTSSSWVGLQVNPRSSLRNVIEKIKLCIRKGISLPSTVPQDAVVIRPPPGLSLVQIDSIVAHPAKLPPPNLMHLRRIADRCRMGQIAPAVVLETIRAYPAWLLEPVGRPLLMVLVDLLEADNYGESQRRIPGVVHSGSPQVISKAAYQALQTLTKAKRGGAFNFSDNQLTTILGLYLTRILLLQDAWQKTSQHASLSIKRRLEIITASLPNEFGKMTDQSILNILHGNALNEASHMASRTTGIRSETFLSAYNRRPPLHIPAIES